jgi:hypothetical protein
MPACEAVPLRLPAAYLGRQRESTGFHRRHDRQANASEPS